MDAKIQKIIDMRQEANREILKHIQSEIETYPDLRFGQILIKLGIIEYIKDPASFETIGVKDPFKEESVTVINRININKTLAEIKAYGRDGKNIENSNEC